MSKLTRPQHSWRVGPSLRMYLRALPPSLESYTLVSYRSQTILYTGNLIYVAFAIIVTKRTCTRSNVVNTVPI